MDNITISAFKKSFRDTNYYIQQLNAALFQLSLKQYNLEKLLLQKGIITEDDSLDNSANNINNNNNTSTNSTLEDLAKLARKSERSVKIINN